MDGFEEKKWFVYMGDHHEGPFSLADIQAKMSQGQVTSASYVWSEGMSDWKVMTEVNAFESMSRGTSVTASTAVVELEAPPLETKPPAKTQEKSHEAPKVELAIAAPVTRSVNFTPQPRKESAPLEEKRSGSPFLRLVLFLGIPGALAASYAVGYLDPVLNDPLARAWMESAEDMTRPYLMQAVEKLPALGKWISPIPALKDVDPAEFEELKTAALASLEQSGPRIAVAVSRADPMNPSFHIATNLPDGVKFDVFVEGVPDTLLNQLSFESAVGATVTKRLGRTVFVRFPDGRPLPRGQYLVYVTESSEQSPQVKSVLAGAQPIQASALSSVPKAKALSKVSKDVRTLAFKTYFLGGPKDRVYGERLRAYHEKLQSQAKTELTELKQFALTLDNRMTETSRKFSTLRSGKLKAVQKKEWAKFNETWSKFDSQMNESFRKWTPQAIQNDFFYGTLYQMTQAAGAAISRLHTLQDAYFSAAQTDPKAFEIQFGEALSLAQTAIGQLKAKVEQAEKLPPSPNGRPQREGL